MKNPESKQGKINEMVRRIVDLFKPDKVILFGSHARGTAGPESDVDLLIVMRVAGSKREKQVEVRLALHDIRISKDIIVVTPEEFEKHRSIAGTIVMPAVKEGKVLYARS
ncbi:MAG: nucleotidyltransferase domain-containing protein [Pseudomonadota bacterium]